MAQPITDYAAFFAGAKQAVRDLEDMKEKQSQLENAEKQLERDFQAKQRAVADEIGRTVKKRTEEISASYDEEIGKLQERLKKARAKREKAKNQGVKERVAEETAGLEENNRELRSRIKTLFGANRVPGFCRSGFYYALFFTKGVKEAGVLFLTLLICFLAIPCGAYFLIPERKSLYLIAIYLLTIFIFGGLYMMIGNRTKMRYMDVLKEGRGLRDKIRANEKQMRAIARSIRKDKNDAVYNLQKYDDEIAQLEQDLGQVNQKKKEALNSFNTVTKAIISDEIMGNNKAELDKLQNDLNRTSGELTDAHSRIKEMALAITDQYEIYAGKDFMTGERLEALDAIIQSGAASNISEAIAVFKSGEYKKGPDAE